MFDRYTAELIAGVPRLRGVTPGDLPRTLTEAYVQVAIARSTLQESPEELTAVAAQEIWADLDSLAAAYETIVLSDQDIDDGIRAATAFVAATAHHGRFLARAWVEKLTPLTELDGQTVPPEVSATLLYLIADANADAAEMASQMTLAAHTVGPDHSLLKAIHHLGRSEFDQLASISYVNPTNVFDLGQIAAIAMNTVLLEALVRLSLQMIRRPANGWTKIDFGKIASLATSTFTVVDQKGGGREATSLLAGPAHLARLLALVEPVLEASALVNLPAPPTIESSAWHRLLERIAKRRPVLWRNHLDAIAQGLLVPGTSAAVTFPTGAGKSTISELKVGTALLGGGDVIFLVPTLALMDQTARSLQNVFPEFDVIAQSVDDGERTLGSTSPKVVVTTPESCLATLSVRADFVSNLALVVFDEAHLLDAGEGVPDQRALDAMLCLLALIASSPSADIMLISAMVRNTRELADWLKSSTNRAALALDMDWKPTRQARAAVIYQSDEIKALRKMLDSAYDETNVLGPPAATKRELQATPYGFFSLRHSWESRKFVDYLQVPLLKEKVLLSASGRRPNPWYLLPNANEVASDIAAASASSGLKVLVFSQSVAWAVSIARRISASLGGSVTLRPNEEQLLAPLIEELGDPKALYLNISESTVVGRVAVHHGLLLPAERRLHELLYGRPTGVSVMVATSTIAQGMNLPSEVVIIAGDSRFDPETDRMAHLKPHEILNAAGRAGRAGQHANGIVLVVPSAVIDLDGTKGRMAKAWDTLQDAFSQGDQCLDVRDPLESILDALEAGEPGQHSEYFLRRIGAQGEGSVTPKQLLSGSLAAFRAKTNGEDDWLSDRVAAVESAVAKVDAPEWQVRLCAATGLPMSLIQLFDRALATAPERDGSVAEWVTWFFKVLRANPGALLEVLRGGGRAFFKGTDDGLGEWDVRPAGVVDLVENHLRLWMSGSTFVEIEHLAIATGLTKGTSQLTAARKFVLRVVPDLEYIFALPSQILQAREVTFEGLSTSSTPEFLSDCVREGVDSIEKLRMRQEYPLMNRVRVHRAFR